MPGIKTSSARQHYTTAHPVREACKKIASVLFIVAIGVMLLDRWWFSA